MAVVGVVVGFHTISGKEFHFPFNCSRPLMAQESCTDSSVFSRLKQQQATTFMLQKSTKIHEESTEMN